MKIVKKRGGYSDSYHGMPNEPYVTFMEAPNLRFNCEVRDHLLPYRFCFVEITEDGDVMLTGTDDPNGYRISISKAFQASISQAMIDSALPEHGKMRVPCTLLPDHTVLARMAEAIPY